MYALGLLFELLTAHMWAYENIFLLLPVEAEISVLFPLAWAGLIMTATSIAERLWSKLPSTHWGPRHLVLVAVWLAVGDLAELLFYAAGVYTYVRSPETEINFILGHFKPLPPTMVLVGYGLLQPLVSQFFLWLERGAATAGPRPIPRKA